MRLKKIENPRRFIPRLLVAGVQALSGMRLPDVLRVVIYRPEFFGRRFGAWMGGIQRGSSEWSAGERELFAAFTSRLNQCPF
jgi:hypothetical protein